MKINPLIFFSIMVSFFLINDANAAAPFLIDSDTQTRYINIAGSYTVKSKDIKADGTIDFTTGTIIITQQQACVRLDAALSNGSNIVYLGSVLNTRLIAHIYSSQGNFTQNIIGDVLSNGNIAGQFTMHDIGSFNSGVFVMEKQR